MDRANLAVRKPVVTAIQVDNYTPNFVAGVDTLFLTKALMNPLTINDPTGTVVAGVSRIVINLAAIISSSVTLGGQFKGATIPNTGTVGQKMQVAYVWDGTNWMQENVTGANNVWL